MTAKAVLARGLCLTFYLLQRQSARKKTLGKGNASPARAEGFPFPQEYSCLEQFQFEMLCIPNHTACRFAEKAQFFRSLLAGRRCAAASRFTFFKIETL